MLMEIGGSQAHKASLWSLLLAFPAEPCSPCPALSWSGTLEKSCCGAGMESRVGIGGVGRHLSTPLTVLTGLERNW